MTQELTLEVLLEGSENRLLDFGPSLAYPDICSGYTVEKYSMWEHLEDEQLQIVILQARGLPRAKVGGQIYSLTDKEMFELDKRRHNGVECHRKLLPVWADFHGALRRTTAWIYVYETERWVQRIAYDSQFRRKDGRPGRHFRLSDRTVDTNPITNNRFSFLDPVYNNGHVGNPPQILIDHVGRKNREAIERLRPSPAPSRWTKTKKRLVEFVADDE